MTVAGGVVLTEVAIFLAFTAWIVWRVRNAARRRDRRAVGCGRAEPSHVAPIQ